MTSNAQTHTSHDDTSAQPPGFLLRKIGARGARWARVAIGTLVGAALGFAYYALVGCATGTCPITSNPFTASLYGALIGGLVAFR